MSELIEQARLLVEMNREIRAELPYSEGALLNDIHELGAMLHEEFTPSGTLVHARVPPSPLPGRGRKPSLSLSVTRVRVPARSRAIEISSRRRPGLLAPRSPLLFTELPPLSFSLLLASLPSLSACFACA